MVLSIHTNIAALEANRHFSRTSAGGVSSMERLSSGLRITKAADDSAGMVIADALQSQARGLGQGIRNANDAISITQVADAALEESIKIINTIRTKSIQAAQDGQTLDSRRAIQSDIQKLMEELDMISATTSFNGQKLLSGGFSDKFFQIGAVSGDRLSLRIASAAAGKIGHMTSGILALEDAGEGTVHLGVRSSRTDRYIELEPVTLAFDNRAESGLSALADAFNRAFDETGVRAAASVISKTDNAIGAGMTASGFSINHVRLGSVSVQGNDADGSLVKAINTKTALHGVIASVEQNGRLVLTSTDGRGIHVETGAGETGDPVFRGSSLTTFGTLDVKAGNPMAFDIKDVGGGRPVAVTGSGLDVGQASTLQTDTKIAANSILAENSILKSPWTADQALTGDRFVSDIHIDQQTTLAPGAALGKGSRLLTRDELCDTILVNGHGATTEESLIKKDSILTRGSILGKGTQLPPGNIVSAGTLFKGDAFVAETADTTAPSLVKKDAVLAAGSVLASGTVLQGTATVTATGPLSGNANLAAGSMLTAGSIIGSGTIVQGEATVAAINNTSGVYQLADGSTLATGSVIASGTELKGNARVDLLSDISGDYDLDVNSFLETGSVLVSGTVLKGKAKVATVAINGNYTLAGGSTLSANSVLGQSTVLTDTARVKDINNTTSDYTIASGSTLRADTILGSGTVLTDTAEVKLINNINTEYQIASNSTLNAGSLLGSGTTITDPAKIKLVENTTDNFTIASNSTLTAGSILATGMTIEGEATIKAVSATGNPDTITLASGTILKAGTVLESGFSLNTTSGVVSGPTILVSEVETSGSHSFPLETGSIASGSTLAAGSSTGPSGVTLSDSLDITADMILTSGSRIASGSDLAADSFIGPPGAELLSNMPISSTLTLGTDSEIAAGSELAEGSVIGDEGAELLSDMSDLAATMVLRPGSRIAAGSELAKGSIIGDDKAELQTAMPISSSLTLSAGSEIFHNSLLAQDSEIGPDDIELVSGMTLSSGMTLTAGSIIAANSRLNTGSIIGPDNAELVQDMDILGGPMLLQAGSDIADGSVLGQGSVVGPDDARLSAEMSLNNDMTLASGSTIGNLSRLQSDTVLSDDALTLASGMLIDADMTLTTGSRLGQGSFITYNSSVWADATLISAMTLQESVSLASDMPLATDLVLGTGSMLGNASLLQENSSIYLSLELLDVMEIDEHTTLDQGAVIAANKDSRITAGTRVGGEAHLADSLVLKTDVVLSRGSVIAQDSVLKNGSHIGGTVETAAAETVGGGSQMHVGEGSILARGTKLPEGTFLTNPVTAVDGTVYQPGTFLDHMVEIDTTEIKREMTLETGTVIVKGSLLNPNGDTADISTRVDDMHINRLSGLQVLTMEQAQNAIEISDAAIRDLGRIRSGIGSVQNQLSSAIAGISATKINLHASESTIRDVDFAQEAGNLSKIEILRESGSFALKNTHIRARNLVSLFTGEGV